MKKKIEGQEMETPGKAVYNLLSFKCLPQIMFDSFFYTCTVQYSNFSSLNMQD
jgi:hypothetical protein